MAQDVLITVGADTSGASAGFASLGQQTSTSLAVIGTAVGQVSQQLTQMANQISTSLGENVDTFASYDQAMKNVQSIAKGTSEEFEQMDKLAVQLASTMPTTSKAVAEGFFQLASAGLNANEVMEVTPAVMNLAAAASTDFETAANGVTAALFTYQKDLSEASAVTEVFQNANTAFKTTMPELADSLKFAGSTAATMGISFEETAAAIGLARNNGLDASQAGSGLRNVLLALASPTSAAEEAMAKYGFEMKNGADGALDLEATFSDLAAATDSIADPTEKAAFLADVFGKRNVAMASALANSSDGFNALAESLTKEGTVAAAVEVQNSGLANQMAILNGSIEEQQKALGEKLAPAQLKSLELKLKMLELTNKLPGPFIAWGGGIALAAANLGKMILPIISAISQTILLTLAIQSQMAARAAATATTTAHTTATGGYTIAQTLANIAASLFPFVLLVIGIAAVIAGIVLLVKNWDTVSAVMLDLWDFISGQFLLAWDSIKASIASLGPVVDFFKDNWQTLLAVFVPFIGIPLLIVQNWSAIVDFFGNLFGSIREGAQAFFSWYTGLWLSLGEMTIGALVSAGEAITEFFTGLVARGLEWGRELVTNIGTGIKDAVGGLGSAVGSVVSGVSSFLGFGSPTNPQMQERGQLMIENLGRGISDAVGALEGPTQGVLGAVGGAVPAGAGGGGGNTISLTFGDIVLPAGSAREQVDALIEVIRDQGSRTGLLDVRSA